MSSAPRVQTQGARIRAAEPRELDRLAALYSLLAAHHGADPRFALGSGAPGEVRRLLETRLAHAESCLLVADLAGDLAGLCIASVARRPVCFAENARGELEALVVRPDARRRGLGRALAEAGLRWLRQHGLSRVELQVARGNAEGRAFWRALGFAPAMDVLERRL